MSQRPLVQMASTREVNQVTGFRRVAAKLKVERLALMYRKERELAPRRGGKGGSYFVGHDGVPGRGSGTNRAEEHVAAAIFNHFGPGTVGVEWPDSGRLEILDYQFPLKAALNDAGVGKIDLVSRVPDGRLGVIELKFLPSDSTVSRADTPLRALLEGLAYCAALEADLEAVREEASEFLGAEVAALPPALIVLANGSYWRKYREHDDKFASWSAELDRLARGVMESVGVPVHFLSLVGKTDLTEPYDEGRPRFVREPALGQAW